MAMIDVRGITASEILLSLKNGHLTSKAVVEAYLAQIAKQNDRARAVTEIAPNAISQATQRDMERGNGIIRGPLHGLPILLKVSAI